MELRIQSILGALVAVGLMCAAQAAPKRPQIIKQFPLDERTVYEIPIGPDVPTTLMFPSALTAIEGANVSANPDTPAPVLLAYTPGRYFFSVRAGEPDAKAAVNVVWKTAPLSCASTPRKSLMRRSRFTRTRWPVGAPACNGG